MPNFVMTSSEIRAILKQAADRPLIVGEHHADRNGLNAILRIIHEAHQAGYRTLGVEVSNEGCNWGERQLPGLRQELEYLCSLGPEPLSEYDELSSLEPDHTGKRPRMNRYWQMQCALSLGWNVLSIDPYHWNWMKESVDGYFSSREPAMAEAMIGHSMIAVVGCAHLKGLHDFLGDKTVYVNTSDLENEYAERVLFARSVPFITVQDPK